MPRLRYSHSTSSCHHSEALLHLCLFSRPRAARRLAAAIAAPALLCSLLLCSLMPCAGADPIIVTPSGQSSLPGSVQGEALLALHGKPHTLSTLSLGLAPVDVEAVNLTRPGREKLAFGVQTQVIPETSLTPAVSIGVRDIANATRAFYADGYYGRAFYVAANKIIDKTVGAPTVLHNFAFNAGLGTGALRGPFGSVSADLPLRLVGTLEYDSRQLNSRVVLPLGPVARLEYDRLGRHDFVGVQLHTPVAF